jgi:hypothetical protein
MRQEMLFRHWNANSIVRCVVTALALSMSSLAHAQPQCPNPPTVTISAQLPSDVCIPSGFGGNPIKFFDDFSWRSFIALVWPVQDGMRGIPDATKSIGPVSGPLVFETFKNDWEVFQPSPGNNEQPPAPSAWNSFAGADPCTTSSAAVSIRFGDVELSSFSHFGNIGEAGEPTGQPPGPPLVGPLPANNKIYTRYSTAYNEPEFNQILNQKLYLRSNLPTAGVQFAPGSIDVKAAWIDMTGIAHPERYYTRTAYVMDPFANPATCKATLVGLVGLHIVQKTPSRPQWIWSSFEQIDNVPGGQSSGPFAYNDGTSTPMPNNNPNPWPPTANPTVFNVQRQVPINPSTVGTNHDYQTALQAKGGSWQFYQLVMTQWPLQLQAPNPIPPSQPGTPDKTFPPANPSSAFANVVLETFDQKRIQTGCMNCHTGAQSSVDFVWSLFVNTFPPLVTSPATPLEAIRKPTLPELELAKAQRPVASPPPALLENLIELLRSAHQQ